MGDSENITATDAETPLDEGIFPEVDAAANASTSEAEMESQLSAAMPSAAPTELDTVSATESMVNPATESMAEMGSGSTSPSSSPAPAPSVAPSPAPSSAPAQVTDATLDSFDDRLAALDRAEQAIENAFASGKASRSEITQRAQEHAAAAVEMAGIAMESDELADEALRISIIAEQSSDRERSREARRRAKEARKKANADHKEATKSARAAYNAIRFSAPNKMGFMRFVQVVFAIHIVSVLVWLVLTSRDAMTYDVTTIVDWVMAVLEGVAFWMFINRYKIARPFVIGMGVFGLVAPAIVDVIAGRFSPVVMISNGVFYIFLILYFTFSKRVKATLVNDLSQQRGVYHNEDFQINRRSWPFYRNLIMYFILFSVLGHWMEMGMCQFIIMGLVEGEYDPTNSMLWRDWLYPFPMEGAAVVIIALVLYPFWQWLKKKLPGKKIIFGYIISFLAGALLCSLIEFGMGLIVNADYSLWDYRENFGNFMGQICLQNTMAFGVVASIITWWVYPMLERFIARIPRDIMNIVFVVVAIFGATIWALYIINPPELGWLTGNLNNAVSAASDAAYNAAQNAAQNAATQQGAGILAPWSLVLGGLRISVL